MQKYVVGRESESLLYHMLVVVCQRISGVAEYISFVSDGIMVAFEGVSGEAPEAEPASAEEWVMGPGEAF